jgi:hypothetical protein
VGVKIMLSTRNKLLYKAFGLRISSDIPLPELSPLGHSACVVDVEIQLVDHVEFKSELEINPYEHVVKDETVLFYVPNHAYFTIQGGRTITVTPTKEADESLIRLYVLGSCMGALLMQRNIYPLHGSAVEIDGKAYAFIGDSGAGKSTLASTFLRRGYRLVSDDVTAVTFSSTERLPMVTPSYPQQKLWQESLNKFGVDDHQYHPIYGRENKFSVPVNSSYCAEPLPLAGLFELGKTENEHIEFRPIEKLERLKTLFSHTYRNFLIPRLGLMEWHFSTSVNIINHLDMYQIRRSVVGFTAPQLVDFILDTISRENQ